MCGATVRQPFPPHRAPALLSTHPLLATNGMESKLLGIGGKLIRKEDGCEWGPEDSIKRKLHIFQQRFCRFYFNGGFSEALFFLLGSKVDYKGR